MHELALVKGLLEAVLQEAEGHGIKKIDRIKIVIGGLTAALPGSLEFAFQVLSRETPARGAALEIEKRPLEMECRDCLQAFRPPGTGFNCPGCSSSRTKIVQGRELYVEFFEGE